jgi:pimeloyl-ACP methyl ester carboxylesterase
MKHFMQHTVFIKNRHNLNVRVCIDVPEETDTYSGLVFINPGLGSQHKKPEFRTISNIACSYGYVAVSFDPTHSFGESDGLYEDATFTNYYEDLEDVIRWASINLNSEIQKNVYVEPFILVGHSLGGMSVAYFTENHPEKVKALAPLSMTISGALSIEARQPEEIQEWKEKGFQSRRRSSGAEIRLKWSHMEDRLKYNLLDYAQNVHVPLLMIVGEDDPVTPPRHQKLFFDAVRTPDEEKEMYVIPGAGHELGKSDVLPKLAHIFDSWIQKFTRINNI